MKAKHDFVTNSSSCSFVGWGLSIDSYEIADQYGDSLLEAYEKKYGQKYENIEALMDAYELTEALEEWTKDTGLSVQRYFDSTLIGGHPTSMKEDQTLGEFKKMISDKFKEIGFNIEPHELNWIEESWMDN